MEDIYITSEGILKIGSLQGAVFATTPNYATNQKHSKESSHTVSDNNHHTNTNKPSSKLKKAMQELQAVVNIPSHHTHLAPLEVLFGSSVTEKSTIYVAGLICGFLLTGKPLIKVSIHKNNNILDL